MTFLGIFRGNEDIDSSESLTTSENVWREVEFESDVDHKEMTRTYGCDDYLSKWLPNIKQQESYESSIVRREKMEKRQEKEQPTRLFKSPCRIQHEGRKSTQKVNQDSKKTYFEAIKCSPMKLRQSLASYQRPKLDNFTLKPNNNHLTNQISPNNSTDISISADSVESLNEKQLATRAENNIPNPKTSSDIRNEEMMALGSLCFRRNQPGNHYGQTNYAPANMVGGKLRKLQRETDNMLLTSRNKQKELLVRCESIMIYPKVLVNHKQQPEKNKSTTKPDKPKTAWQDNAEASLTSRRSSLKISENHTRLPQLGTKHHTIQTQKHLAEKVIDKEEPICETRNTPPTKIIIPFGEEESRQSAEKCFKVSPSPPGVVSPKAGLSLQKGAMGNPGERGITTKTRCLKESSKVNEQTHSTQSTVLDETQDEMAQKQLITTQYFSVTTPSSPLKKFRIPTGNETSGLFVGRENYPPKRTVPYRFSYSQRGGTECNKGFDGVSVKQKDFEDNSTGHKENLCLKIGGKGLLKTSMVREKKASEKLDDEDGKKRVQFLLQSSRYFTL